MKILYLITKSEAGGAQTHVADLCRHFKKRGDDVRVMSSGAGWLRGECLALGVQFAENKYFSNSPNPLRIIFAVREIQKYIDEFKPDIVHCHSSAAAFLGRLAVRGKIRTIYTAHGWGFNLGMNPIIRFAVLVAEKFTAKYTDKYICVSEFVRNLGLSYNFAPADKFTVVYNGVDVNKWNATSKNESSEKVQMIFVGRLAEPKRPELTMEAIASLPDEIKNKIQFTIIGDGPKLEYLRNLASEKNITTGFSPTSPMDIIAQKMNEADIFLFISAWEGLPYTVLEAMSCGLPVIASNVGGVSEEVDESCGILVNNDAGQIARAILKLVNDSDLRLKMGEAARKIVEQKFSLDKMLKKADDLYHNI